MPCAPVSPLLLMVPAFVTLLAELIVTTAVLACVIFTLPPEAWIVMLPSVQVSIGAVSAVETVVSGLGLAPEQVAAKAGPAASTAAMVESSKSCLFKSNLFFGIADVQTGAGPHLPGSYSLCPACDLIPATVPRRPHHNQFLFSHLAARRPEGKFSCSIRMLGGHRSKS